MICLLINSMVILLLLFQYKCEGEFDCCPFTPWLGTVPIATKLVIMGYLLTKKKICSRGLMINEFYNSFNSNYIFIQVIKLQKELQKNLYYKRSHNLLSL